MPTRRDCGYTDCPYEAALDMIGGRWKTMIIAALMDRTLRFNELRHRLKRVTHRVLTAALRDLEADGLVHREVYAVVPPRVDYSLTDLGRTLRPLVDELGRWGTEFALQPREATPAQAVPNEGSPL